MFLFWNTIRYTEVCCQNNSVPETLFSVLNRTWGLSGGLPQGLGAGQDHLSGEQSGGVMEDRKTDFSASAVSLLNWCIPVTFYSCQMPMLSIHPLWNSETETFFKGASLGFLMILFNEKIMDPLSAVQNVTLTSHQSQTCNAEKHTKIVWNYVACTSSKMFSSFALFSPTPFNVCHLRESRGPAPVCLLASLPHPLPLPATHTDVLVGCHGSMCVCIGVCVLALRAEVGVAAGLAGV